MEPAEDHAAGFSTLEVLVAFLVLALGIATAAQSISQASLNIGKANAEEAELKLVDRLLAEEVPLLLRTGSASKQGDSWSIAIVPIADGAGGKVVIDIQPHHYSKARSTYVTALPLPEPAP